MRIIKAVGGMFAGFIFMAMAGDFELAMLSGLVLGIAVYMMEE